MSYHIVIENIRNLLFCKNTERNNSMTKITPPNVDLGVIKIPHDLEKKVSSTLNSTDQSY